MAGGEQIPSSPETNYDATSSLGGTWVHFPRLKRPIDVGYPRGTGTDSPMFPSIQTPVIVDPCRKPQILRQVCSIALTVAGAAYVSGSSGKIYARDAERCSYRRCSALPGARQREIAGLPDVTAR